MLQFPASVILHGGDITQDGDVFQEWVDYFNAMAPVGGSRLLAMAVGNHEYRGSTDVPMWQRFFRVAAHDTHYAIDIGAAHVMVINSCFEDDATLVDPELDWLKQELAKPAAWKIVMFHHPAYSIGIANIEISIRREWKTLQDKYVPFFEALGADLVLNGHTHLFERSKRNNVNYLTAGPAGGKMGLAGASNPYSLVSDRDVRTMTHFELDAHSLRGVTLDLTGNKIDELLLSK
jgi:hypothetical protein